MDTNKRKYKKHKEGYSVSVSYYLRKDADVWEILKSNNALVDDPAYPLYIRVAFLGQTVKLRSRLGVRLTESSFEQYMALPHVARFVEDETLSIRYSIEELKPDTIENFRNSQWSAFYNKDCVSLYECVEDVSMHRLRQALYKKFDLSQIDVNAVYSSTMILSNMHLLAHLGIKPAIQLQSKIQPVVDAIKQVESTRFDESSGPRYVLWDWKAGTFQSILTNQYPSESPYMLNVIGSIIAEYDKIRDLDIPFKNT